MTLAMGGRVITSLALPPVTTASARGRRRPGTEGFVTAGILVGEDDGLDALLFSLVQFIIRSVSGLPKPSSEIMAPSKASISASLAVKLDERCLSARVTFSLVMITPTKLRSLP